MEPQLLEETLRKDRIRYVTEMLIMADWHHGEVDFVLLKLKVEAADQSRSCLW